MTIKPNSTIHSQRSNTTSQNQKAKTRQSTKTPVDRTQVNISGARFVDNGRVYWTNPDNRQMSELLLLENDFNYQRQGSSMLTRSQNLKRRQYSDANSNTRKKRTRRKTKQTLKSSDSENGICDSFKESRIKRNSEDEYELVRAHEDMSVDQIRQLEIRFRFEMRQKRGFRVKNMKSDGNCLFRAIADQIYGDEELHFTVRRKCMDHISMNQASFCQYLTEDFGSYIARKRQNHEFGNYLEMIALSEVFRRAIELYHYSYKQSNTFCGERANLNQPMRISFHVGSHYNSIQDPNTAFIVPFSPEDMTSGPFLKIRESSTMEDILFECDETDPNLVVERDQIEQVMLDDKLRATDCEATDAEILQTVANNSYIEWLEDHQLLQPELFQILKDIQGDANMNISVTLNEIHPGGSYSDQVNRLNWFSPEDEKIHSRNLNFHEILRKTTTVNKRLRSNIADNELNNQSNEPNYTLRKSIRQIRHPTSQQKQNKPNSKKLASKRATKSQSHEISQRDISPVSSSSFEP